MKVEYYLKKCGLLINNTQTVNYTHFVKLLQDWNKEHSLSEKKINEIQSFFTKQNLSFLPFSNIIT